MFGFLLSAGGLDVPPGTAAGILDIILQHGITGALLILAIVGYYRKDRELASERASRDADADERIKDARDFMKMLSSVQDGAATMAQKFITLSEGLEKQNRERQIVEQAAAAAYAGHRKARLSMPDIEPDSEDPRKVSP